jgi:hypothetical protein
MSWPRLPKIGHPGGPGGRFLDPPPVTDQRRHQKRRKRKAKKRIRRSMNAIFSAEEIEERWKAGKIKGNGSFMECRES